MRNRCLTEAMNSSDGSRTLCIVSGYVSIHGEVTIENAGMSNT